MNGKFYAEMGYDLLVPRATPSEYPEGCTHEVVAREDHERVLFAYNPVTKKLWDVDNWFWLDSVWTLCKIPDIVREIPPIKLENE